MERSAPARKPRASTADLLTWPEVPASDPVSPESRRPHQPTDGVSKVVFGGQITEEEAESILKRKPCSGSKLKEMSGSGIFVADNNDSSTETESSFSAPTPRTGSQMYQQTVNAISQISFTDDGIVSTKKPTSVAGVAKQRELSGSLQSESDSRLKKQLCDAKCKELSGHDIFAPTPEVPPRSAKGNLDVHDKGLAGTTPGNSQISENFAKSVGSSNPLFGEEPSVKTAKKIYDQKIAELSGNGIFKDDSSSGAAEKSLSTAKLKEMSGSDIFADGQAPSREYLGGVRKPPGGESSISLV